MRGLVPSLLAGLALAHGALGAPALEPGVSLALARWRAGQYADFSYAIDLQLKAGASQVEGRSQIQFSFRGAPQDLVLDWHGADAGIRDVAANGRPVPGAQPRGGHLIVPRSLLKPGENVVSMSFTSGVSDTGGPLTRFTDPEDRSEYWYTLFVPAEASAIFPCVDQPDLKARFTLTLSAPQQWRVVSNAPLAASDPVSGGMRHRFLATEPISPYLFAFAAGPFERLEGAGDPTRLGVLVRRSRAARARAEAPALLRLVLDSLGWFGRYFASPFPFAKYDLVLVPELAYGGMEHAGATFLREESVLFPFEPSSGDLLNRAELLLHETSHQWFGDLVTMRWFDDLWLKEGFANFMATKAAADLLHERLPGIDPWVAFSSLKSSAYRTDATQGTTPIWQAMPDLSAAKSAYGAIVYAKAPAVLRQAEFFVGEDTFREGVREFLHDNAYAAADWNDLVKSLEHASGRNLHSWANTWVKRRGMPRVTLERKPGKAILVQRDVLGSANLWPMRLRLIAGDGREVHRYDVRLHGRRTVIDKLEPADANLLFANDGDYGYGQFLLDARSREQVLDHPDEARDPLLRGLLFGSLWESVREAELDPARYVELALHWLPQEADDLVASTLLARLRAAYLRYLPPARRVRFAPRVEQFLFAQMHSAPSASRRIAYLRAFLDVARSDAARSQLKDLLAGRDSVPGVPLRSRDRFGLIETLLAAGDPEAEALLETQSNEDPSAEGRRYAFGTAAARPAAAQKRALLQKFLIDPKLPESWIEEALVPFNELDQAPLTQPLLMQALEALPALKRKHTIFFVADWLAAFLGGQSSPQALRSARRFLAHARLDADLRRKVLEALDTLERTVKIRARFSASEARVSSGAS